MPTLKKLIDWVVIITLLGPAAGCVSTDLPQATAPSPKVSTLLTSSTPVKATVLQDLHNGIYEQAQALIAQEQGARPDGYIYTVDLSQFLAYAALNKDRRLYTPLRDFAVRHLILKNSSDPYTWGFVIWRYREGSSPDASGTTEALRLAESLWLGSQVFGDRTDREQAVLILKGYTRHAHTDNGFWLIRNYFNLKTRTFATNSFLVGYDPDFLHEVAQATGDPQLQEAAQQSYSMIRRAVAPSGLLYDIIQPEVLTLVPELKNLVIFSPNDIVKLANTCTVAERTVAGVPEIGQRVLHFALERLPELSTYYYGRTSEPVPASKASAPTYACLVRLAAKLKDQKALNAFLNPFVTHADFIRQNPKKSSLYTVNEVLLALQSVLE
jgi:hypothetical protein